MKKNEKRSTKNVKHVIQCHYYNYNTYIIKGSISSQIEELSTVFVEFVLVYTDVV